MIRKTIKKIINKINREIKNNKSDTRFIENELAKIKIKTLELVLLELDKMKCRLIKQEEFDDVVYVCSNCGETWVFNDGTPKENNYNYCPNCGYKITEGIK